MLVLHDPATLLHSTVELLGAKVIPAHESADRICAILTSLEGSSHELRIIHFDERDTHCEITPSLHSTITQTHSEDYIQHLSTAFTDWVNAGLIESTDSILPECFRFPTPHHAKPFSPPVDIFARPGYYAFDMSSGIMFDSYKSIIASANLAYEATKLLYSSTTNPSRPSTILALTRPPGHHCNGHLAGGYCYINNAAIAVSTFHSLSPSPPPPPSDPSSSPIPKTAILDLDFHHGNGTQHIFYSSPCTLYVSIHGRDEFPYYTGSPQETGVGDGEGYNLNLPLTPGSSFEEYLDLLCRACTRIREFAPAFVVVSLGFDTFHLDPLGKFAIETEDYQRMGDYVRNNIFPVEPWVKDDGEVCREVKQVNTLIVLEGGYVVDRLGENVLSWLKGWEFMDQK